MNNTLIKRKNNSLGKRRNAEWGLLPSLSLFDDIFSEISIPNNYLNNYHRDEDEKNYLYEFDMPGLEKKDIDITLDNGSLSITAHTKTGNRERSYSQHFKISRDVPLKDIKAEYNSGVLLLRIPKHSEKQKTTHKITVG